MKCASNVRQQVPVEKGRKGRKPALAVPCTVTCPNIGQLVPSRTTLQPRPAFYFRHEQDTQTAAARIDAVRGTFRSQVLRSHILLSILRPLHYLFMAFSTPSLSECVVP